MSDEQHAPCMELVRGLVLDTFRMLAAGWLMAIRLVGAPMGSDEVEREGLSFWSNIENGWFGCKPENMFCRASGIQPHCSFTSETTPSFATTRDA